ncbi:MAG: hypothetical protein Q4C01_00085 [Clostridia bacterium]|nr:hypothetical protein [Clostridia bacterium]
MKTAINKKIFKEQFRRLRLPMLIIAVAFVACQIGDAFKLPTRLTIESIEGIVPILFAFPYVAGFIAALSVFSVYNKRSSCDFYLAIPVKRTTLFLTSTLAVAAWTAIGIAASILFAAVLNLFGGFHIVQLAQYAVLFCVLFISTMLVYAMCSIGCIVTGRLFSNIVMSQVVLWLPRFFLLIIFAFAQSNVSGFVKFSFEPLNPTGQLACGLLLAPLQMGSSNGMLLSLWPYIYSLILLVAALAVGCILFNRRRAELAETSASTPRVQNIQAAITLLFAWMILVTYFVELNFEVSALISTSVLVFVWFLIYQSVCKRSLVKALKSIGWYFVSAAVGTALVLGARAAVELLNNVEVDANDIKGIYVEGYSRENLAFGYTDFDNDYYENYVMREVNQSNEITNKIVAEALEPVDTKSIYYVTYQKEVRIELNSGVTLYRRIVISEGDKARWEASLQDNQQYQNALVAAPDMDRNQAYYFERLNGASYEQLEAVYAAAMEENYAEYGSDRSNVDILISKGYYGLRPYLESIEITVQNTPNALNEYTKIRNGEIFEAFKTLKEPIYRLEILLPEQGLEIEVWGIKEFEIWDSKTEKEVTFEATEQAYFELMEQLCSLKDSALTGEVNLIVRVIGEMDYYYEEYPYDTYEGGLYAYNIIVDNAYTRASDNGEIRLCLSADEEEIDALLTLINTLPQKDWDS